MFVAKFHYNYLFRPSFVIMLLSISLHACHGLTVMIYSKEEVVISTHTLDKTYCTFLTVNVVYAILNLQRVSAGCCWEHNKVPLIGVYQPVILNQMKNDHLSPSMAPEESQAVIKRHDGCEYLYMFLQEIYSFHFPLHLKSFLCSVLRKLFPLNLNKCFRIRTTWYIFTFSTDVRFYLKSLYFSSIRKQLWEQTLTYN